jgi:hypothetical protein
VRVHGCCHGLSCVCNICSWCGCGHRAIHCEILLLEAPPGFLQGSQLLHTISTLTCLLSPTCSHLPALTYLLSLACSHLPALTYLLSLTCSRLTVSSAASPLLISVNLLYQLPFTHPTPSLLPSTPPSAPTHPRLTSPLANRYPLSYTQILF